MVGLCGCGQGEAGGSSPSAGDPTSPTALVSSPGLLTSARAGRSGSRLPYSRASAHVVQAQPAPGSCHAIGSGLYSRPDPRCTPGALNPAVTQATIGKTICRSGWTKTVRPPAPITDREKVASMAAYGDSSSTSDYEYDHLVSLELGGAVNDARNLWPEPGASPNPKDAIEGELRRQVCDGDMSLAQAHRAIASNWVALAHRAAPPAASAPATHVVSGAHCTVTAAYSSRYHDYDVYMHSNQRNRTVLLTDAAGHTARWHTDASGYADVYLRTGANDAGETVTARVGGAACQGAL
jgi:hypothetical protein